MLQPRSLFSNNSEKPFFEFQKALFNEKDDLKRQKRKRDIPEYVILFTDAFRKGEITAEVIDTYLEYRYVMRGTLSSNLVSFSVDLETIFNSIYGLILFLREHCKYGILDFLKKNYDPQIPDFISDSLSSNPLKLYSHQKRFLISELIRKLKANNEAHWPKKGVFSKERIVLLLAELDNLSFGDGLVPGIWHLLDVENIAFFEEEERKNFRKSEQFELCIDDKIYSVPFMERHPSMTYGVFDYDPHQGMCDLSFINLEGACLTDMELRNLNLCYANLQKANLEGSTLHHIDFTGANFTEANLEGVDFSYRTLVDAEFRHANMKGAVLVSEYTADSLENIRGIRIFRHQLAELENPPNAAEIEAMEKAGVFIFDDPLYFSSQAALEAAL